MDILFQKYLKHLYVNGNKIWLNVGVQHSLSHFYCKTLCLIWDYVRKNEAVLQKNTDI